MIAGHQKRDGMGKLTLCVITVFNGSGHDSRVLTIGTQLRWMVTSCCSKFAPQERSAWWSLDLNVGESGTGRGEGVENSLERM